MSTKGHLTREQAVAQVGEDAVAKVDAENCEFTIRVMDDGMVEFSATVMVGDDTLTAYYYQAQADVDAAAEMGQMDWTVEGYEVA